ncbi:hypothetical protein IU483_35280 [Streptomyces gardneri]|nr:hypothetical protein [Streptomyces gardneri]
MDFTLVVPTLNLSTPSGEIDSVATRRYANLGAETWIDHFLLNGSTTRGDALSVDQRASVLDIWIDAVGPERVLACCWNREDINQALTRRVTPMVVMSDLQDRDEALGFLASLPGCSTVYSHPVMFDGVSFDADIAEAAAKLGCLPTGGKLAKIRLSEISQIRQAAPAFRTWDGSSRHIADSLEAGADGVVATPLTASFPNCVGSKTIHEVQAIADPVQATLDELPDRPARTRYLHAQLRTVVASC